MILLGIGLLILSSYYIIYLFNKFNEDKVAKQEINSTWQQIKLDASNNNPFAKGRWQNALKTYKNESTNAIKNPQDEE